MGNLCVPMDENTAEIDQKMREEQDTDNNVKKLLFLGAGGAGKSTIFKQLKSLHANGLTQAEKVEHVESIRTELIANMKILIKKSQELAGWADARFDGCAIDFKRPGVSEAISAVTRTDYAEPGSEMIDYIKLLWMDESIQCTWSNRQFYGIPECAQFFFENIDRVCNPEYEPTESDLLLARVRTTGIVNAILKFKEAEFHIYDVGGQRNERKKWVHCFDNVTAVIFVASLSSYCEVLFEEERTNGMRESLKLFGEVANSRHFGEKDIILFLNKRDLFEERIRQGKGLDICFGDEYDGLKYDPERDDEETCLEAVEQGIAFIQEKYSSLKERRGDCVVYIHITQATDKTNVEKVFWDVQNFVLRGALRKGHLL